jgi:glutamine synthetase
MNVENIQKMIIDEQVEFVDLRFCDTSGKEQHVSMPVSMVDEDFFEEGKMFDGSSIKGWKGINESDMVLMPDLDSAVMDPFMEHNTMIIRCDVLEPDTMEGYNRCPRSLAKRAEPILAPSRSFSYLIALVLVPICIPRSITSTLKRAPGIPVPSTRKVTTATVLV